MKVFVTGPGGYIGGSVAARLAEAGHALRDRPGHGLVPVLAAAELDDDGVVALLDDAAAGDLDLQHHRVGVAREHDVAAAAQHELRRAAQLGLAEHAADVGVGPHADQARGDIVAVSARPFVSAEAEAAAKAEAAEAAARAKEEAAAAAEAAKNAPAPGPEAEPAAEATEEAPAAEAAAEDAPAAEAAAEDAPAAEATEEEKTEA